MIVFDNRNLVVRDARGYPRLALEASVADHSRVKATDVGTTLELVEIRELRDALSDWLERRGR